MRARRGSIGAAVVAALVATTAGTGVAKPAAERALGARQVHRIVAMTDYRGLRSHRFYIAGSFTNGRPQTVVIRLDRARLAVPLREVRKDVSLATALAAHRPSFTASVKLGGRPSQHVRFDIAPSGVLDPRAPYLRYIVFTPRGVPLASLTRPRSVPSVDALTVIDAADRMNVTLLQDHASGARWGPGVPAASLAAMVECLNTGSYLYVARGSRQQLQKRHIDPDSLIALGREIWSNSLGFAIVSAREGTPYGRYMREAESLRFNLYPSYGLHYLTVAASEYRRFAAA